MSRQSLKNVIRLLDEATKDIPVEQRFLTDLKRSIELTAINNKTKGSQSYKPSSMNCIRQMYYIVTGKEPEVTGETYTGIGICNAGSDIHKRMQQAVLDMKANGMDCEYVNVADYVRSRNLDYLDIVEEPDFENGVYETKLYHKPLNMSFLCDGIIRYEGKYYIIEFKTENSSKLYMRKGVEPVHYNQGTAYSMSLQINDVLFVYISRDVLDMKAFILTPTDKMKEELVGKIQNCDEYVHKLKTPPRPIEVPRKICEYCNFKELCRKES